MLERTLVPSDQIRRFPLFRNLSEELLGQVRRNARTIGLSANEPVFRQHEPIRRSYFCLNGRIKLFRVTSAGTEKIFHIATPGESLCDCVPLGGERCYPMHCSALVTSEVMTLESDLVNDLFRRSPPARDDLIEVLMNRLETLLDHAELLSVDKAHYRVASFLIEESRRQGDRLRFRLYASKKNVASYLSLQPETLSRCLGAFRESGLADTDGREIRILDLAGLRRLAQGERTESGVQPSMS